MHRWARAVSAAFAMAVTSASGADPDVSALNAKLKACGYHPRPDVGTPCIDRERRDLSIERDRLVFREWRQQTPYTGAGACRNETSETWHEANVADLSPDIALDKRDKDLWLALRCKDDKPCIKLARNLLNDKPWNKPPVGTARPKIDTALSCDGASSIAADLGQWIQTRRANP